MESTVVRLLQKSRGEAAAPGAVGSSANPPGNETGLVKILKSNY